MNTSTKSEEKEQLPAQKRLTEIKSSMSVNAASLSDLDASLEAHESDVRNRIGGGELFYVKCHSWGTPDKWLTEKVFREPDCQTRLVPPV